MKVKILKDWKLLPDGREKYGLYLASREWAVLKEASRVGSGSVSFPRLKHVGFLSGSCSHQREAQSFVPMSSSGVLTLPGPRPCGRGLYRSVFEKGEAASTFVLDPKP